MSEHVLDRLSEYLDGELSAPERERLRSHLAACAACAGRLAEIASVDAALRSLPGEPPPGYFERLPGRVRARLAPPASAAARWWWFPALGTAAALLALAVVGPALLRPRLATPARQGDLARQVRERAAERTPAAEENAAGADKREAIARVDEVAQPSLVGRSSKREADTATAAPPAATPPPAGAWAAAPPPATQAGSSHGRAEAPEAEAAPGRPTAAEPARAAPGVADERAAATLSEAKAKEAPSGASRERRGETLGAAVAQPRSARNLPGDEFRALQARTPRDAAEARALREAWRRIADTAPEPGAADEARVRVIEMGVTAWRQERRGEDRALVERDAAAYLGRPDARQAHRVRALLEELRR